MEVAVCDAVIVAVALRVEVVVAVEVAVEVLVEAVAVAVAVEPPVDVAVATGVADAVVVGVCIGVAVGDGLIAPTPMSFTFCGLFSAASLNFSRPFLNLPIFGGVKVTPTGQLAAGSIAPVHPFESRLNPAPDTITAGADNSTLLLLVSVTICGLLRVPAGTLPKLIFLIDSATASLLLAAGDCATRPPGAARSTQTAIATAIAWRENITRRGIYQ
ncbi:MAG TPA: hypothetical protein VK782_01070 [Candidatus Sulfotelmatobacter sp.]|nr:hypothetical protein [Candidatus Sulfotelmatobacter sp.]